MVNLLKSYRHVYASSNIADDNPVSPREGIQSLVSSLKLKLSQHDTDNA
ncbi:hypothetical protein CSC17_0142 [Klebsiella oxytoca]|nr:hypothetical protein CSC17_0142 [Klebsiella oxytoca]